jgi:hypothetical protein
LPRAENDFCAPLNVLEVLLCNCNFGGLLLLYFDVCLGIVWDGCGAVRLGLCERFS